MKALVVTGGTQVDIDDVRTITNFSGGRFGVTIANALARERVNVTLLCSEDAEKAYGSEFCFFGLLDTFRTYEELALQLKTLLSLNTYDFIFMPAAVSDYAPVKQIGKIASTDEVTLTLKKLPKILPTLREICGVETFIVGFKLLVGVTDSHLCKVAHNQNQKGRLNMTFANDLQKLRDNQGQHPGFFCTIEGGSIPVFGGHADVASKLVTFAMARQNVHWSASQQEEVSLGENTGEMLEFALSTHLLNTTAGNVSSRSGEGFWITPRGVEKSSLTKEDLVPVQVDLEKRIVSHQGAKASIDSPVHARLYQDFPELQKLFHFHEGFVVDPDGKTEFPYPCGTSEEAQEAVTAISSVPFTVELADHGYLIGLDDLSRVEKEWSEAQDALKEHWRAIDQEYRLINATLYPIFTRGASIVGVVSSVSEGHSVFLMPAARGLGYGRLIVDRFKTMKLSVIVHDECHAIDFYLKRGFTRIRRVGSTSILKYVS